MVSIRALKTVYALRKFLFNFIDALILFVEIISPSADLW
jgi:hypothetical protein